VHLALEHRKVPCTAWRDHELAYKIMWFPCNIKRYFWQQSLPQCNYIKKVPYTAGLSKGWMTEPLLCFLSTVNRHKLL
jgi:hypothetical protein